MALTPEQAERLEAVKARSREFPDEIVSFVNEKLRPAIEAEDWFEVAAICGHLAGVIGGWGEGAVSMSILDLTGNSES